MTNKNKFFGYDLDILKENADLNGVKFETYEELKEGLKND